MPPSPRNSPKLEVAKPRDTRAGGADYESVRDRMLFLFGDDQWRPVQVRAWWTDDRGRRVVFVAWTAELSTWEEAFLADQDRMRPG